jgi:hypothetical protein
MAYLWIPLLVLAQLLALVSPRNAALGQSAQAPSAFPPKLLDELEVLNGRAEVVTYRGQRAVRLVPSPNHHGPEDSILAILARSDFQDGVIEAEVAGIPRKGVPSDSRGFIGISFRVQPHGSRFENLYLRPTNGRADDQVRRNHSLQYTSEPEYPWYRLRQEEPGMYESYVDLEPGAWTHLRIVVSGTTARLYINGAVQPALIVSDLKLKQARGQIALWAHWTTDGYFSNLRVQSNDADGKHYEYP